MRLNRIQLRKFRRHWLTVAFFAGFVVDSITLNRVDQLFDNFVLASYVILSGASLAILYAGTAEKIPKAWREFVTKWAPLMVQFSFGGLFSGILIFYSRSGSWFSSWPFLLLILSVIVGNELLRKRAQQLIFNIVVFFVGLFSYLVLAVPVVLGKMGAWIFIASGVLSLVIVYLFVRLLFRIIPNFMAQNIQMVVFSIGITFFSLNFLYFANIIPPIPLSLKNIGIYHNVERHDDGSYTLTYEDGRWFEPFKNSDDTFHYQPGDNVFCYAAVFAPTRLSTTIFHRWEFFDEAADEWITRSRLSYDIEGGRDGGFRGFTFQEDVHAGKWRCTVETVRKQKLGSETFRITFDEPRRELENLVD